MQALRAAPANRCRGWDGDDLQCQFHPSDAINGRRGTRNDREVRYACAAVAYARIRFSLKGSS